MSIYKASLGYKTDKERRHWEKLIKAARKYGPKRLIPNMGKFQRWLVLPDVHRPFHDKVLWGKVLKLIDDMGPDLYGIVLNGDYLDLYTLGSYNKNSLKLLSELTLTDEYIDGLEGIDELEQASHKGLKKKFLFGNHEDRYFRHMSEADNAKYGGALLNPIEALYLHEKGWEVKTDWKDDYFTLGKYLDVIHGIYTNVHTAKNHLDKLRRSCMFGHTHRIQSFQFGDQAAFNIGGLYDIDSKGFKYMPRAQRQQWANGFAIVNIDDDGFYYVEQVTCWNGKFLANGKMY